MPDTRGLNGAAPPEIVFSDDDRIGYRIASSFAFANTYLLVDSRYDSAIIVDPGVGCFEILEAILERSSYRPNYVILTHEHYDHIGSLNQLRDRFSVKVIASVECSSNIRDPKKNLSVYFNPNGYICEAADIELDNPVTEIPWCGSRLLLVRTPGHTNGGISIYLPCYMFTGDTLIKSERTVVKLPGGDQTHLAQSLKFITESFSPDVTILPGHGDSFLLAEMQPEVCCPSYFTLIHETASALSRTQKGPAPRRL